MAQDVLAKVQDLLNEEKWTRATIENYTRKNFVRLDNLIDEASQQDLVDELKNECQEHLKHASNSIISLYIIGIINYEKKALDNNDMSRAISLFRDNRKWSIVEFLAERVLSYEENKRALKALAAVYQHTNREDELWRVWERLVKIDHSNTETAYKIAAHYEEDNPELAVYYYKLTLKRMLMQHTISELDTIWKKLARLIPEDLDFFYSLENKLQHKLDEEDIAELFSELLPFYQESGDVDTTIRLLETIIGYDPKNKEARSALVDAFSKKYEGHSKLEETLALASIDQPWKALDESLETFYSNIAFDEGDYVYHRSWGIGEIIDIEADTLIINFDNKKMHRMELDMALKSLIRLDEGHLWIVAREEPETLKKMAQEDMEGFLKIVLDSFGKETDTGKEMALKDMKEEIFGSGALTKSQWSSWWTKAKKIFKKDPQFGTSRERKNAYFLRNKPMTLEEEIQQRFETTRKFTDKLKLFGEYLNHSSEYELPAFHNMVEYFQDKSNIDPEKGVDLPTLESILLLERLQKHLKSAGMDTGDIQPPKAETYYKKIESPAEMLIALNENEDRKIFYQIIRKNDKQWPEVFSEVLHTSPSPMHYRILDELILNDKNEYVDAFVQHVLNHYREDIDHLIWIARLFYERREREDALHLEETNLIIALLNSLPTLDTRIRDKSNIAENRKRQENILDILFKEGRLTSFIKEADEENIDKVLQLLPHIKDHLDDAIKNDLLETINSALPGINFRFTEEETEEQELHPFLTTRESYERKQADYKHIVEVDIPENSKDIALALEKGDLSENAEYKAALEHQEQLKSRVAQLDRELKQAKVVSDHEVTVDEIGFGNRVTLHNLNNDEEEEYTLLGEWDSDPGKRILSYKSPLGRAMLGKTVDDEFEFNLHDKNHKYKVVSIDKADIFSD